MKTKIKLWILKMFFSEGEMMLIKMAIEDNVTNLEKIRVKYKNADPDCLNDDINTLKEIAGLFSTKIYK